MEIETTITTEKVVSGTLLKPTFIMSTNGNQEYYGKVSFPVSTGDELIIDIPPEDWNNFWTNFNNGKYLLELVKAKYNLDTLVIPENIETWFSNYPQDKNA